MFFAQFEKRLQAFHLLCCHSLEDRRIYVPQADKGAHRVQLERLDLGRQAVKNGDLVAELSEVFLHLLSDVGSLEASIA